MHLHDRAVRSFIALSLVTSFLIAAPMAYAAKFVIGDRVQVSSGPLNVRSTPATSGKKLGTQPTGALGTVVGGPTAANGYTWWNINYDAGADGWSVEDYLTKVTAPPPAVITLQNGVTVNNLSGAAGAKTMYQIAVPANATNLRFVTSGGTGDVDIYTKFGAQPSTTVYDLKSDGSTNNETITIPTPQAGTYYLLFSGFAAYSGVSLVGAYDVSTNNALKSQVSNLCLKAASTPITDGTGVVQYTCGYSSLAFVEVPNGSGINLKVTNTNYCLNISGNSTTNGAPVVLYTCNNVTNEQFTPTSYPSNYRSFKAVSSGKCLDITGHSTLPGAVLQQWDCTGESQQLFVNVPDSFAPSVPAGLSGNAASTTAVTLSWTASIDNVAVTGYKIFRGGVQVATVTSGTSYTDTGLTPGTTYSYTVAAFDAVGNTSAQSASVNVTTFSNIVPRDAYSLIQTTTSDQSQGVTIDATHVGSFDSGDWVRYNNVQFGTVGALAMSATLAVDAAHAGQSIEIRLDGVSGTKIGTLTPQSTGDWLTYQEQTTAVTKTTGMHDVYLVAVGTTAIADFRSFKFSTTAPVPTRDAYNWIQASTTDQSQGVTIDTVHVGSFDNGDWVRYSAVQFGSTGASYITINLAVDATHAGQSIEVHLDSLAGPKIGTLVPQSTGGWTTYQIQSAAVTQTTGIHDVYLVAVGTTAIADIAAFKFSTTSPTPPPPPPPPPGTLNTIDTVVNDMKLSSDANGIGQVNAWGPVVSQPDPCVAPSWWPGPHNLGCWNHLLPWLVVFPAANPDNSNPSGVRVQIRDLKVYYFSKSSQTWSYIAGGYGPTGTEWYADFSGVSANPGNYRVESDGSISVIPPNGRLWHGWTLPMVTINPTDVGGIFATLQARLIPNTPGGAISSGVRYLVTTGADYKPPDGSDTCDYTYCPGVGTGRFKLLPTSGAWIPINFHSMSEAQIRAIPPPLQ